MKLTYWYAHCKNDSEVYSIRARTKKAAMQKLQEWGEGWEDEFEAPVKTTVEYKDGFDLLDMCSNEWGKWWEARARV